MTLMTIYGMAYFGERRALTGPPFGAVFCSKNLELPRTLLVPLLGDRAGSMASTDEPEACYEVSVNCTWLPEVFLVASSA
jgi:hypothetical protein